MFNQNEIHCQVPTDNQILTYSLQFIHITCPIRQSHTLQPTLQKNRKKTYLYTRNHEFLRRCLPPMKKKKRTREFRGYFIAREKLHKHKMAFRGLNKTYTAFLRRTVKNHFSCLLAMARQRAGFIDNSFILNRLKCNCSTHELFHLGESCWNIILAELVM